MNVLIIVAHPSAQSESVALAHNLVTVLDAQTHTIVFHNLYDDAFNPVMQKNEFSRRMAFDLQAQEYTNEIEEAEHLFLVHPDWWGGPPAILKGWVDRILQPGVAYEWEGKEFNKKNKKGLFGNKKVTIACSTDSEPGEVSPKLIEQFWSEAVFGYCGVRNVQVEFLYHSRTATWEEKEAWKRRVSAQEGGFNCVKLPPP